MNQHKDSPRDTLEAVRCCDAFHAVDAATGTLVRTTTTGECMVLLALGHEEVEARERLLSALVAAFPTLTSVLWTINPKKNDTIYDLDIQCFHGRDHIVEELPDGPGGKPLRFRIGPKTFFQTNPQQTIAMYKLTRDLAQLTGGIAMSQNEIFRPHELGLGTAVQALASDGPGAQMIIGLPAKRSPTASTDGLRAMASRLAAPWSSQVCENAAIVLWWTRRSHSAVWMASAIAGARPSSPSTVRTTTRSGAHGNIRRTARPASSASVTTVALAGYAASPGSTTASTRTCPRSASIAATGSRPGPTSTTRSRDTSQVAGTKPSARQATPTGEVRSSRAGGSGRARH